MVFTFSWVHGITAGDVEDKTEFPAVFEEFHSDLEGALLLAHNAGFDAGVLRGCMRAYGVKAKRLRYLCTLRVARTVWPELPSKSLDNLARHLGLAFRHHNAAEDARVCAEIALAAASAVNALEVADLQHRLDVWRPPERAAA
jgi:DNA polymerase-3 subunit epsilon